MGETIRKKRKTWHAEAHMADGASCARSYLMCAGSKVLSGSDRERLANNIAAVSHCLRFMALPPSAPPSPLSSRFPPPHALLPLALVRRPGALWRPSAATRRERHSPHSSYGSQGSGCQRRSAIGQ